MIYDNHDERIQYFQLMLHREHLEDLTIFPLPEGYRFSFYRPGDRDAWIEIERSAKEFKSYEEGLQSWKLFFEGKDEALIKCMVFLETQAGEKIGTATAFYDIHGRDTSGAGWLHWVAIKREFQGKGLSKPLVGYVLNLMKELGYPSGKIPTQSTTWVAVKVYLDFGFVPIPVNAVRCHRGWSIVKTLTNHPALKDFDILTDEEIMGKIS